MSSKYAQAVIELLRAGTSVDAVLKGLFTSLVKNRHQKLHKKILGEVLHSLDSKKSSAAATLTLAHKIDEKTLRDKIAASLKALGVEKRDCEITIERNIIGGHILTTKEKRIDGSYKNVLLRLYCSVIEHT